MPDRMNRKLKQRIDLHARQILLQIAVPLEEPLIVPAVDADHQVTIVVAPAGVVPVASEQIPGKPLSHIERAIWDALAEKPLIGKVIAARTKDTYDSTFRVILSNLQQRGVIVPDENGGYARATCCGQ